MNPLSSNVMKPAVNPLMENLANTIQFARTFQSPQAFLQELQRQNPQMAQQLMYLAQTVRDPLSAAHQMLAQQGINPNEIQALLSLK